MSQSQPWGCLGVAWGVFGLVASLVEALYRLTPIALEPLQQGMSPAQMGSYAGFVALNAYAEGYRGFQLRFAPRVAARARHLYEAPTPARMLLAPLFLAGLYEANRRRLWASWLLVAAIVALVLLVRSLPQPWRGIIDAGVVVGLGWGTLSLLWFLGRAARGRTPEVELELPESHAQPSAGGAGHSVRA